MMSRISALRLNALGWLNKSRWQALRLRWMGWKCEGPFPPLGESRILILGPGLSRGSSEAALLVSRLRFNTRWMEPGQQVESMVDAPGESRPSRVKWLVPHNDARLLDVLKHCHASGKAVQLINVAPRCKRIRCNTPFQPGKFTEREGQYIHRLFSYDG